MHQLPSRQSNPLRNTIAVDQIKETQVTRDLGRPPRGQRNVLVVARVHTHMRFAQPKMILAENARKGSFLCYVLYISSQYRM